MAEAIAIEMTRSGVELGLPLGSLQEKIMEVKGMVMEKGRRPLLTAMAKLADRKPAGPLAAVAERICSSLLSANDRQKAAQVIGSELGLDEKTVTLVNAISGPESVPAGTIFEVITKVGEMLEQASVPPQLRERLLAQLDKDGQQYMASTDTSARLVRPSASSGSPGAAPAAPGPQKSGSGWRERLAKLRQRQPTPSPLVTSSAGVAGEDGSARLVRQRGTEQSATQRGRFSQEEQERRGFSRDFKKQVVVFLLLGALAVSLCGITDAFGVVKGTLDAARRLSARGQNPYIGLVVEMQQEFESNDPQSARKIRGLAEQGKTNAGDFLNKESSGEVFSAITDDLKRIDNSKFRAAYFLGMTSSLPKEYFNKDGSVNLSKVRKTILYNYPKNATAVEEFIRMYRDILEGLQIKTSQEIQQQKIASIQQSEQSQARSRAASRARNRRPPRAAGRGANPWRV
jgi:hypothetical protein